MCDWNQLNQALRSYDAAMVTAIIGNDGLLNLEVAQKFVLALRQSSCLAIQIQDAAKEARRDALAVKCRELLACCPDAAIAQDFEDHFEDARIAERGYRDIFQTMRESEIWKQPPAIQAWGMVLRAEREFAHVKQELDKEMAKVADQKHPLLDPRQLRLQGEERHSVRPDAVINGIVRNAGDTLVTVAYVHGWFDRTSGAIVLPQEVPCDDAIAFQAGTFSLVASQWRCLEHAWDRSRLFKARFRLREQDFDIEQGGKRRRTVLEVQPATPAELRDHIALRRLEQVFIQAQWGIEGRGAHEVQPGTPAAPIPLAKAGYLSPEERVAAEVLDGNYCVPVDDASVVIAGLSLKAWVRGYAYYAKLARDAAGNPLFSCVRLSETQLVGGLVTVGLSDEQARTFVQHTTFGRGAADLFDAPLLRTADAMYCFFAPAFHAPTLGVIVLSRISSLNRRRDAQGEIANDCQIEDKGKLFERRVLGLFTEAGVSARSFSYRVTAQITTVT